MSLPEEKRRLQIQGRIDDIDAELEELQNKRHDIPLADIYTAFEGSHNRKSCGAGELKQYKCYITRFTDWMKERFPRVEVMRQVTADHANRFADVLSKDKTRRPSRRRRASGRKWTSASIPCGIRSSR